MNRTHTAALTFCGSLLMTSFLTPAFAQPASGIEEIIVTARKKEEALIEVPVSVAVLSAEDIEQRGVLNLQDVALFTPGLSYFDAIQSQLGTPVIRGLSQTNLNSPDRNVAVFYGGVYLSNLNATNLEILDVERIEVVKGPQSALYGRNAFNGAINYVPAAPTKDFFAQVTATIGTDNRHEEKAVVAGPITETVSGRLAVSYNSFDGSWENQAEPEAGLGGYETKNISGVLDFQPNDAFNARVFGYYTDDVRDSSPSYIIGANNCGPAGVAFTAVCGDIKARPVAANPDSLAFSREVILGSLDMSYDFGPVKISSLTSRYEADTDNFSDYTLGANNGQGQLYNIVRTTAPTVVIRQQIVPYFTGGGRGYTDTTSQELRLEGDEKERLRWTIGGFYYKNNYNSLARVVFDGRRLAPGEVPQDFFGFGLRPGGVAYTDPQNNMLTTTNLERRDEQWAYFGSVDFDVTDQITVGGEIRRDNEDRSQVSVILGPTSLQEGEFNYTTWRAHADFELNPDQRFYASAAKGVISGYFNATFDAVANRPVPANLQAYNPAKNITYEAGWKSRWMDGTVNTELSVFYIDYTDIQINATPPPPLITNVIQNIGDASSKGFEFSINAALTDELSAGGTLSYTPTKFGKGTIDPSVARYCGPLNLGFCPTLTFNGVVSPDVSGQSLPRSPETLGSVFGAYDTALNAAWEMYLRGDVSYTGKTHPTTIPFATIPSRTIVNARLGFRYNEDLDIAFWGRNIFDKKYAAAVIFQPPNAAPLSFFPNVSLGERATYGLTATYKFN
jgi:iron complex outermembrane receptor protein